MKKTLLAAFLLFNALFSLYQFDIMIKPEGNISVKDDFGGAEPNFLFYKNDTLYIADLSTGLLRYQDGSLIRLSSDAVTSVVDVFVADNGFIYMSDNNLGLVRRSPYRVLIDSYTPHGIYMLDDSLYLADFANDRIMVTSSTGTYEDYFGRSGMYTGEFNGPEDLQISGDNIYVADSGNRRVEQYLFNFTYVRTFGGREGVELERPTGIFVDDHYVYVADTDGDKIVIYTHDGYPVYAYSIPSPNDVLVTGKTLFISRGYEGKVLVANITLPDPYPYVSSIMDSLPDEFGEYASDSEVAQAINVSYNSSISSTLKNAKFALQNGAYGEAFYGLKSLNTSSIPALNGNLSKALSGNLTALAKGSVEESAILSFVNAGNYSAAYSLLSSSGKITPPPANVTDNATNATINATNATNATGNVTPSIKPPALLDTGPLANRLDLDKALAGQYHMNISFSDIESALSRAGTNQSAFDLATALLNLADERINSNAYRVNSAQDKINALNREIGEGGPFTDYSSAMRYASNASAILYFEPETASQLADKGMLEVQKADAAAGVPTYIAAGLALLAILAIAAFLLRDKLFPHGPKYNFQKEEGHSRKEEKK